MHFQAPLGVCTYSKLKQNGRSVRKELSRRSAGDESYELIGVFALWSKPAKVEETSQREFDLRFSSCNKISCKFRAIITRISRFRLPFENSQHMQQKIRNRKLAIENSHSKPFEMIHFWFSILSRSTSNLFRANDRLIESSELANSIMKHRRCRSLHRLTPLIGQGTKLRIPENWVTFPAWLPIRSRTSKDAPSSLEIFSSRLVERLLQSEIDEIFTNLILSMLIEQVRLILVITTHLIPG